MPQFDTFIFSSSLFYFIISFLLVLYNNHTKFLPRLSSILKLRFKISNKNEVSSKKEITSFTSGFVYNTVNIKE